jgi:hypothetical protein
VADTLLTLAAQFLRALDFLDLPGSTPLQVMRRGRGGDELLLTLGGPLDWLTVDHLRRLAAGAHAKEGGQGADPPRLLGYPVVTVDTLGTKLPHFDTPNATLAVVGRDTVAWLSASDAAALRRYCPGPWCITCGALVQEGVGCPHPQPIPEAR